MDKRFTSFLVVCFLIIVAWGWIEPKIFPKPKPAQAAALAEAAKPSPVPSPSQIAPVAEAPKAKAGAKKAQTEVPERRVLLENTQVAIELSTQGARITSWRLKGFKEFKGREDLVELVPVSPTTLALRNTWGCVQIDGARLEAQGWRLEKEPALGTEGVSASFVTQAPELGLSLRKVWTLPSKGTLLKQRLEIVETAGRPVSLPKVALLVGPSLGQPHPEDSSNILQTAVLTEKSLRREGAKDKDEVLRWEDEHARWAGLKNHYFAALWIPVSETLNRGEARRHSDHSLTAALYASGVNLAAGGSVVFEAELYGGTQDYDGLKALGRNLHKVIDFGFMSPLAIGMLKVLQWLYVVTRNYGLAIILLTALVKLALWFPTHKGMTSMRHFQKAQAKLQPRLETLKKVYKDDPKKLNEETMKLYQELGINPLSGCLPMLVQIPIFIALYSSLNNAFELRGAPFFWFWDDLSAKDPFYVLPLFMGVTMWIQQKITPTVQTTPEAAQQQKIMLWMMPIMLTVMAAWMGWPVGLLLYMSVQNVLGIAQQVYINRTVD